VTVEEEWVYGSQPEKTMTGLMWISLGEASFPTANFTPGRREGHVLDRKTSERTVRPRRGQIKLSKLEVYDEQGETKRHFSDAGVKILDDG